VSNWHHDTLESLRSYGMCTSQFIEIKPGLHTDVHDMLSGTNGNQSVRQSLPMPPAPNPLLVQYSMAPLMISRLFSTQYSNISGHSPVYTLKYCTLHTNCAVTLTVKYFPLQYSTRRRVLLIISISPCKLRKRSQGDSSNSISIPPHEPAK